MANKKQEYFDKAVQALEASEAATGKAASAASVARAEVHIKQAWVWIELAKLASGA